MRILDLFSGAGGAARGYLQAGHSVTGVDTVFQPHYPGPFILGDALEALERIGNEYDLVHASPPCQLFSTMTARHGPDRVATHPDLVGPVRDMLKAMGLAYVIENVPGAPLIEPTLLCGSMLGLEVRRHRLFETSMPVAAPGPCRHEDQDVVVGVYGHPGGSSVRDERTFSTLADWRRAMRMPTLTGRELALVIPPAYTAWIARHF